MVVEAVLLRLQVVVGRVVVAVELLTPKLLPALFGSYDPIASCKIIVHMSKNSNILLISPLY